VRHELPTLEGLNAVLAAIQAAAMAGDYPLAINLLREHALTHLCLGCTQHVENGFQWRFGFAEPFQILMTCRPCTEDFALWYVSKSPSRRMFEGALRGYAP